MAKAQEHQERVELFDILYDVENGSGWAFALPFVIGEQSAQIDYQFCYEIPRLKTADIARLARETAESLAAAGIEQWCDAGRVNRVYERVIQRRPNRIQIDCRRAVATPGVELVYHARALKDWKSETAPLTWLEVSELFEKLETAAVRP